MLLVNEVSILSRYPLHLSEIDRAEQLLRLFVKSVKTLYQENYITIKMHSLLHIVQSCRYYGPLSEFSATMFESCNGKIIRANYSKISAVRSLISNFNVYSYLPSILDTMRDGNGDPISDNHPFYKHLIQCGFSLYSSNACKQNWISIPGCPSYYTYNNRIYIKPDIISDTILRSLSFSGTLFDIIMINETKIRGINANSKLRYSSSVLYNDNVKKLVGNVQFFVFNSTGYFAVIDCVAIFPKGSLALKINKDEEQ